MRHYKAGIALLLASILVGALVFSRAAGPRVRVAHAKRQEIVQTVVTTGRVLPPAEIRLAALVSGNVLKVNAEVGARVTRGAPLVVLDGREAQAALGQAKAALSRARAQRRQVRSVSAPVLDQSVTRAKTRLDDAKRQHADYEKLHGSGAIAKAELDRSKSELALAQSELASALARARAAAPGGADSATASASIAQAEAELRSAELRVERGTVTAPVDGIVLERSVEPGDTVQVGDALLVIAQTGQQEIVIEPDEKNLALLAVGQSAVASAEAFPSETFPAKVSFIAPSVDPKRGTIEVRLAVPTPPTYLRPAMTVSVEVEVARRRDTLVVDSALVRGLATESPWVVVARNERAHRVDVRVGLRGDERVEVTDGIDEASAIIFPDQEGVVLGGRVRPEER